MRIRKYQALEEEVFEWDKGIKFPFKKVGEQINIRESSGVTGIPAGTNA